MLGKALGRGRGRAARRLVQADLAHHLGIEHAAHREAQRLGQRAHIGRRQRHGQALRGDAQRGGDVVDHVDRRDALTLRHAGAHLRHAALVVAPGGHQRLRAQVAPANAAPRGQPVLRRAPQHPRAVEQRAARHVVAARPVGADGEVGIAAGHRIDEALDRRVTDAHADLRALQRIGLDGRRQDHAGDHLRRRDAHDAGGAQTHVGRGALGQPQVLECRFRRAKKLAPGRRRSHLARAAVEQAKAHRGLQLGDQLAHRRRREPQPLAGRTERPQFGHRDEGFELAGRESSEGHGEAIR